MNGELDVYAPFLRDLALAVGIVIASMVTNWAIQKWRGK